MQGIVLFHKKIVKPLILIWALRKKNLRCQNSKIDFFLGDFNRKALLKVMH